MRIRLDDILGDIVLDEAIYDPKTGAKILSEGAILNKKNRDRLKKLGIEYIGTDEVKTTIDEKLREETVETLSKFQEELFNSDKTPNLPKVVERANDIVESVRNTVDFNYDLNAYLHGGNDIYTHSVRVASFAVNIAKIHNSKIRRKYNKEITSNANLTVNANTALLINELEMFKNILINPNDITIAAILHDIGKVCEEDKENLNHIREKRELVEFLKNKFPGVDDSVFEEYDERYSAVYSYALIAEKSEINTDIKRMVLLSNEGERQDRGVLQITDDLLQQQMGYTFGAKIIHLCDIYDKALKRAIEEKLPFEEIVSELGYYGKNGYVSSYFEELLISSIPFYPKGTKVMLSNGEEAIVIETFFERTYTTRPKVRLVKEMKELDLRYDTTVTIKHIVPNLKYSEKGLFEEVLSDQVKSIKNAAQGNDHSAKRK